MPNLSLEAMRAYLSQSISSLNQNKLRGLLAEVDLRDHLANLGFGDRVSRGGWIARTKGDGIFGDSTIALFPEIITPGHMYPPGHPFPAPDRGLHTICSTLHQSGINSFFCAATIERHDDPASLDWSAVQLGLPTEQPYRPLVQSLAHIGFQVRTRNYNFLRYKADASAIPDRAVPEEFTKEHLRISFNDAYKSEISDIDGLFWGQQHTYPMEIKEKTSAKSDDMGDYFGLDIGPFVKLAFYAAKRGNLRSLFVVKEIDNIDERNLIQWRFITYDDLAQSAGWGSRGGGTNMQGGNSAVVRIPKVNFRTLDAANLRQL
jgi:hypothetical protein